MGSNTGEKNMNQSLKQIKKIKQRSERKLLLSQSWKSDNQMGSNIEDPNILPQYWKNT